MPGNMKNKCLIVILFCLSFKGLAAQTSQSKSVVEKINASVNEVMKPVTEAVESLVFYSFKIGGNSIPFVLVWLIVAALFFTIYFKFINVSGFKHAIKLVAGKYDNLEGEKKKEAGQVSHFQALTTALSGTVGLGNISGVAIAIAMGGPGATFWMILAGILGMSSKFVECTLGVKYRRINPDGSVSGGPMYYLKEGFSQKKLPVIGKVLAVFFAIMCIGGSFGGGNMYQANEARNQFTSLSYFEGTFVAGDGGSVLFGLILAILIGVVIIGGIKSIAKVTDKIVPFMCGLYVICAIGVLVAHFTQLPDAFYSIFSGAFSPEAAFGGFIGVLVQGFKRAAFSNEAGIGSAAIAHSAVKTDEPVTEGLVALLEPFIDTVVVCTMTALVIIVTGAYTDVGQGIEGVEITASAFSSVFGSGANIILTLAVVLFAFSTAISWSYYGLKAWTFLFGEGKVKEVCYKVIFCLFTILGSILSLKQVVGFSDSMIFAMCLPNIIGLYMLSPIVREELNSFMIKIKSFKKS
jgi:AGCS family alanine or glycine:cation symporter